MKIIYSTMIVIILLDSITSTVKFQQNEIPSLENQLQNPNQISIAEKNQVKNIQIPERQLYLKKNKKYNIPKDIRKLSKSQMKRIEKMYKGLQKKKKRRRKRSLVRRRKHHSNHKISSRKKASSRYQNMLNLFASYINPRKYEVEKGTELATFWCAAKYCINNRNVLKENPGSGEQYKSPAAFSMTENTAVVNRLQGEEIGIYNEYKSGKRRKHDDSNNTKLREKCLEVCQNEVKTDITNRKNALNRSSSGRNSLKLFGNVYNSSKCAAIRKADNNAKFELLTYCKQVGTTTIEACWSAYGTPGIQACNFKYYEQHGYPANHISKIDKQSIESDNYNHALTYYTNKGTFNCTECGHNYPHYYRRFYCHFAYKNTECDYMYGKPRKNCIKKKDELIHTCNNLSYSVCIDKCSGGDKKFYYDKHFKEKRPTSYSSVSSTSQCQGECDKYNNIHHIYNQSQAGFKAYFNKNCGDDCKVKVAQSQASSGSKAIVFSLKLNTFIGRVRNKQIERNKYDDQHIHKSKRMSMLYNRDAIFDAILLMENKIYEEQTSMTTANEGKSQTFESELLNKIMKLHVNEKDFDKYDDLQLNIFDLKMN